MYKVLRSSANTGTQACIQAVSTVTGIVADLDTVIMFASSGTLMAEPGDEQAAQRFMESLTVNLEPGVVPADASLPESFSVHREAILRTAKALVEDTKSLVVGTLHYLFIILTVRAYRTQCWP